MTDLLKTCKDALHAAGTGADIEAYATTTVHRSVRIERNDIHLASSEESSGIGIRTFLEKAVGFASTNSLEPAEVSRAAGDALAIARASHPDDANVLPEKTAIAEIPGLHDPAVSEIGIGEVLEHASHLLSAARSFDGRVTLDHGGVTVYTTHKAIANTNGVEASEISSAIVYYVMGMARDGDEVSAFDFEFDFQRTSEGVDVEKVGRELARRLVATLGATKGESFRGPVLFAPDALSGLLCSPVMFSANAENVQKGRSRWAGRIGDKVASAALTMTDNGLLEGGVASSAFDREGVGHRELAVIERGVLQGYMYDTRTALRDNTTSTGHAGGSTTGVPTISPTNVTVLPGEMSKDEIIADMKEGLVLNRLSGGPNPVTGDFSGVVKGGFLVKNGAVEKPLTGTLIQGNIYEAMQRISAISKETKRLFSYHLPYVRVEDLSITSG
ncbi:TldD/PmbA family protein [Planctomycetota bacterium]